MYSPTPLMPTSKPYEQYLVGELAVDFADDIGENDFLRAHDIGSWLTAMPQRFPLRVDFPLDGVFAQEVQ